MLVPSLIRAQPLPRLPGRPELRRIVDGVGEPRADADREAAGAILEDRLDAREARTTLAANELAIQYNA